MPLPQPRHQTRPPWAFGHFSWQPDKTGIELERGAYSHLVLGITGDAETAPFSRGHYSYGPAMRSVSRAL